MAPISAEGELTKEPGLAHENLEIAFPPPQAAVSAPDDA